MVSKSSKDICEIKKSFLFFLLLGYGLIETAKLTFLRYSCTLHFSKNINETTRYDKRVVSFENNKTSVNKFVV